MSQGDNLGPGNPETLKIKVALPSNHEGGAPSSVDFKAQASQEPSIKLPAGEPDFLDSNVASAGISFVDEPYKGFVRLDPAVELGKANNYTEVDVIGVPAIGGDPERTWMSPSYQLPRISTFNRVILQMPFTLSKDVRVYKQAWITRDIRSRKNLQKARVVLYDHGSLEDEVTLKILANRLLQSIRDLRQREHTGSRPFFFVCHSTGGLVAKMALVEAQRSNELPLLNCLHDCYGVTFLGCPHRGSSYLSMPNFSNTIRKVMNLSRKIPQGIADCLQLDHPLLQKIDSDFKPLAADLKVWTFFETVDSDLTNSELVESERYPFHAPITSIKSALLNFRHEVVYPLLSDHTRCASFGVKNEETKEAYLSELADAVEKASVLGQNKDYDLDLENCVDVEVIGFYATLSSMNETSVRVVSTGKSLNQFLREGPESLLISRLQESNIPAEKKSLVEAPEPRQHLRLGTHAISLLPNDPKKGTKASGKRKSHTKNKFSLTILGAKSIAPELNDLTSDENSLPKSPSGSVTSESTSLTTGRTMLEQKLRNTLASASQPELSKLSNSRPRLENTPEITLSGSRRLSEDSPIATHLHPASKLPTREDLRGQHRLNETTIHRPPSPLWSKLDDPKQKLLWIHVPFNVPNWVKVVLERLSIDRNRDCHKKLLSIEHWESKHQRGRHSEHHACFLKPGCSFIPDNQTLSTQMCLYLPYLHFDTYKMLVKRRNLIKDRVRQGRCRPVPQSVAKLDSLEFRAIWKFLGHDPPINCRRTLDQFGYPSLHDTRARDDDQMLYKLTRAKYPKGYQMNPKQQNLKNEIRPLSNEKNDQKGYETEAGDVDESDESEDELDENIRDGNVLMVDQLWLWVVDNKSTVTFFPKKESLSTDGRLYQQADLRNSIFNEINADLTSKCENSFDLAALAALHAVTVLFERTSHVDLEVFRVFEEAISILTEKMTTSFKQFRAQGFRDKATDYFDSSLRTTNIREKHKSEGERAEKRNRENTSALLELRDIEDELNTLKELFNVQSKIIKSMKEGYEQDSLRSLTANGISFLSKAERKLTEYTKHAEKMIESVKSTRDDFDKLLQMVQRQDQVDEVRLARLQADLASAQSRSVMIFTVFTVIFLPLTFFTALFGMNTQEWGGGTYKTLQSIGIISLPSSAALVTLALIVAWSMRMRRAWNVTIEAISNLILLSKDMVWSVVVGCVAHIKKKERQMEKRKRKKGGDAWEDMGPDFWESHKVGRDNNYRVPSQNLIIGAVNGGK